MDLKLIKALVRIMKAADVTELELDDNNAGTKVRIRRGPEAAEGAPVVHYLPGAGALPTGPAPAAAAGAPAATAESEPSGPPPGTTPVTSPMVGTLYHSPSPEAEPFVQIGSLVGPDTVLCIVEAMKVMNEIKSEISGEIVQILVENGEPVEHGQPLFLVKTS